jgi:hypothetical protein
MVFNNRINKLDLKKKTSANKSFLFLVQWYILDFKKIFFSNVNSTEMEIYNLTKRGTFKSCEAAD